MKPPSRPRNMPSRFLELKKTKLANRLRPVCSRLAQRNLLHALRQQKKLKRELDILALQKKVPQLSLLQIQNMIKFLKKSVVKRVYLQVRKQEHEEQKNKVPIELWAELAEKMAGNNMETISSAFSQMLIIAATEPSSLHHSDPPRTADSPSPSASSLRTIPLKPMPKSHTGSPSPVTLVHKQASKTPQLRGKNIATNPSASTTTVTAPSTVAEKVQSELLEKNEADKDPSTSATPKSLLSKTVSKPTPPVCAPSTLSTTEPSLASHSGQPDKQHESGQTWQHRPMGMKSVVDFENIYLFISNIIMNKPTRPLTAMESAVFLDLLMSLPEELPLLDCKKLQHHFLQMHAHLNKPAAGRGSDQGPAMETSASARKTEQQTSRTDQEVKGPDVSLQSLNVQSTEKDIVQKGPVTEHVKVTEAPFAADGFGGQSSEEKFSKVRSVWDSAGLCPLNPFMVPVAHLKRK